LYQPHGSSKFRLYIGLLVNPNVYRKLSKEGEADDDDDDDNDDGPTDIQTNTKDTSGSVLPARSAYSVELDDHDDDDDSPTDIQTNTKDTSGSVLPARSAYSVELDDHDNDEGTMQARKSDPSSLLVQAAPRFDQVSLDYITFLTFLTYVCMKCLVP
jgi:hypothetical protein